MRQKLIQQQKMQGNYLVFNFERNKEHMQANCKSKIK